MFKGTPNKKYNKIFNNIFPVKPGVGYYGSQFSSYLKCYKFFMEKFNLKLYEANDDGNFVYCLTNKNPNDSFLFDVWYIPNSSNLKFKEIKEIKFDVCNNFIVYDKTNHIFKIEKEENINKNFIRFTKLDSIFDIIDNSSFKDSKYKNYFNREIKNTIDNIFNNSKKENPAAIIPFFAVSKNGLSEIKEWDYEKIQDPPYNDGLIIVFKNKKINNIKNNYRYNIGGATISSGNALSNAFRQYLYEKMMKDLNVDKLDNAYNIINKNL